MGIRLTGFDYTRPYYYMVTLRRLEGLSALSAIDGRGIVENAITRAFHDVIKNFHLQWYVVEPIWCYVIMPDHIHLLIKLAAGEKRVALGTVVHQLMRALAGAYWENAPRETGPTERDCARQGAAERGGATQGACCAQGRSAAPVFAHDWHDWIVKRDGQLDAFITYIRENPMRSWLRRSHREYFQRVNEIEFLGRKWYGYGNAALLKLPVIEPFRCSRKWAEGGEEWSAAVARASRIGPGGAGIGTFMSPCEKACGHAIGLAGGRWIVLSPEGFGERWHPGRQYEKYCAEGRMLFLSLWSAMAREPTRAELYQRCHEMGDLIDRPDGAGLRKTGLAHN